MLTDTLIALIRQVVPLGVSGALAWLGMQLDIVFTETMTSGTTATVVLIVSGAYYALARLLESKWPWTRFLLGTPRRVRSGPRYEVAPKRRRHSAAKGAALYE